MALFHSRNAHYIGILSLKEIITFTFFYHFVEIPTFVVLPSPSFVGNVQGVAIQLVGVVMIQEYRLISLHDAAGDADGLTCCRYM